MERKLFINGAFVESSLGSTFPLVNPATGQTIGQVHEASQSDVERAVAAAKAAFEGPWGKLAQTERLDMLRAVSDGIMKRFDDFLDAEVQDTGKPHGLASTLDVPRGAANFRVFADITRGLSTECFSSETKDGLGALNYSLRSPLGVVGVICPWNLPLLLMTWKVAPALACGNTVVVKPSEETPSTATLLGEVFRDVGVPDGVYNVVHGFGPGSAGEFLTRSPDIAAITFTGESATGQAIMKTAAEGIKPISFELGGKNPAIVFEDADLEEAIAGTLRSTFSNCGQVCLCSERVYVHRSIFDRFVQGLKEGAEALKMGMPEEDGVQMGPLISETHQRKVLSYFDLAREEGATIVTGGSKPDMDGEASEGFFVQPTILTGLSEQARCVREEIFGPVCHIQPFDTEEEALAMANDSPYGLCAAVWTQDIRRAHRMAARLEVGVVWVNTWFLRDLRTPFGGVGISGLGREGGVHSIGFYSELRNVCIKL